MPWIEDLAAKAWCAEPHWCPEERVQQLRAWALAARQRGEFRAAGIGRQGDLQSRIRGDEILWVTPGLAPELDGIWQAFENLRVELNRELYLGLDHFEVHLAVYPPGQAYDAHIDQARGTSVVTGERVISSILYLNENWEPTEGGELVIYEGADERARISPQGGTLVLFRSHSVLHAVQAPVRERWSLTGWFRRR